MDSKFASRNLGRSGKTSSGNLSGNQPSPINVSSPSPPPSYPSQVPSMDNVAVTPTSSVKSQTSSVYNNVLTRLNIAGNGIGPLGAKDLAKALLHNTTISYLDVSNQSRSKKIGPDGTRELAALLRCGPGADNDCKLVYFKCAKNNIGFEGCR